MDNKAKLIEEICFTIIITVSNGVCLPCDPRGLAALPRYRPSNTKKLRRNELELSHPVLWLPGGQLASRPRPSGQVRLRAGAAGAHRGFLAISPSPVSTSPPADLARGCSAAPRKLRLVSGMR